MKLLQAHNCTKVLEQSSVVTEKKQRAQLQSGSDKLTLSWGPDFPAGVEFGVFPSEHLIEMRGPKKTVRGDEFP